MKTIKSLTLASLILLMCSCEKFTTESENVSEASATNNVSLQVTENEAVKTACQRLSFGIFKVDEKIKTVNQTLDDTDFGTAHLSLSPGTYRIVAIGHNGSGNCTISSPEKVTFYNNKMTDTFSYYGTIEVNDGENTSETLTLKRAVAMFRLHITDSIPSNAKRIKFYYTGGSSTLNATTGYGCVNSKQTETFDMSSTQKDYEIYTFPHEDGKKLKIVVSVLDDNGTTIVSKTFEDVTVTQNYITKYSGKLFDDVTSGDSGNIDIDFVFNPEWAGETVFYF